MTSTSSPPASRATPVIPSGARDLGGLGAMPMPAAPPAQVPRSARDDTVGHPATVVIALGSTLGDRAYHLRRAIDALPIRVVRISTFVETEPVDAPPPMFLNAVVIGYTSMGPHTLMNALLALEKRLGRARRGIRNQPRIIDLD